ncbi:MAG: hypothetical protein V5A23_08250 [Halobacteriales archaeon]
MISKRRLRIVLLALVLVSAVGVAQGWATRPPRDSAPAGDGVTAITAQGRDTIGDTGRMVAFGPDGEKLAEHSRYNTYFDVDPVEGEEMVVEFVAVDYTPEADCPEGLPTRGNRCARQVLLRTDVRTNETTVVWETYYSKLHKMHDFDRINETHVVVADIWRDAVHVVNVSSGERTWSWYTNESYARDGNGSSGPEGWTHINDVEIVRDGWIMATLRNFDRTVFIDPGEGVVRDWTIGCEDCHDVLYEHHNSDYMPGNETEPPTVIIADSENDRIVEFQRVDGDWEESWTYTNADMHWPRDADRLPNGHTLITDSNANRVYEIDGNDQIIWQTAIGNPYEAERLGTGDESANLPRESTAVVGSDGPVDGALLTLRSAIPSKLLSGALFVLPYWAGVGELLFLVVGLLSLLALVGLEVHRRYQVGPALSRLARRFRR